MNIFDFRRQVIEDYAAYTRSFIQIRDPCLQAFVDEQLEAGVLWPEPLIQLNPSFEPGATIDDLVAEGVLHRECNNVFRIKSNTTGPGRPLRLHRYQEEAIRIARGGHNYVLITGTGSGKSLAYMVPIVDHVLRQGSGRGIRAIVVYPMNALANSQDGELQKSLPGLPGRQGSGYLSTVHRPGVGKAEGRDHCPTAGHPADELCHAGADPDPAAGTPAH